MSSIPNTTTNAAAAAAPVSSAAPPPTVSIAVLIVVGVLSCAFVCVGTWASYWAERRTDQYQLLALGKCLHDGGRMYLDCWENKPPGIAWINAFALTIWRGGQLGAWLLPAVTLAGCLGLFGWAAARLLSPVSAAATTLLAAVVYSVRLYDTPSINPDFYSSVLELGAASLFLAGANARGVGPSVWLSSFAGLLWAASTCVKPTGVAGLVGVSLVGLWLSRAKGSARVRWPGCALFAWLGFAVGWVVPLGLLLRDGTIGDATTAVFTFNRELLSFGSFVGAVRSWLRASMDLAPLALPLWLALVGLVASFRRVGANRMSWAFAIAILIWWLLQTWMALVGPSQTMRYWQATFPPMLWLASAGVFHLENSYVRLGAGHRRPITLALLTLMIVLGRPLFDGFVYGVSTSYLAYESPSAERAELSTLGESIGKLVPEDQPIYVWAYDPGLYLYADRRAASRFMYPRSDEQMRQILRDLEKNKPHALLMPQDSSPEFENWCDIACYQTVDTLLLSYELRSTIGRYHVWVRKGSLGA